MLTLLWVFFLFPIVGFTAVISPQAEKQVRKTCYNQNTKNGTTHAPQDAVRQQNEIANTKKNAALEARDVKLLEEAESRFAGARRTEYDMHSRFKDIAEGLVL